jgi:tRNA-Thr(GGU) m(6)t(6)A37 methyltransferase TsaA
MSFALRAVGVVRGGLPPRESGRPRPPSSAEVEGRIEILPGFAEALDGLEAFSHAFVISYFHLLPEDAKGLVKVKPRRHRREGVAPEDVPTVGVFATDSPARPNPIGLSLVEIVRREGNLLVVRGLDLYDGTPVLDIKPYRTDYKAVRHDVPSWVAEYDKEREPL